MSIRVVSPNVRQAYREIAIMIKDLQTDLDGIEQTSVPSLFTCRILRDQIKDLSRILYHVHVDDNPTRTVERVDQLLRTIGRLVPDDEHKQERIDNLNSVRSILLTNDDGSGGSDPVIAINQESNKMFTDKYIGAVEERIEGLILDLDGLPSDHDDVFAIEIRLDDLSRLHSDMIRRRNPHRAEALIDDRISRIEEYHQQDEVLARQRIADLIYLKDVLTGKDPQ